MLETLLSHLNMARLSVGAAAVVAMVGCTGVVENKGTPLTPEQQMAQQSWLNQAYPHLSTDCGGCHAGTIAADPTFLMGADPLTVRQTLLAYTPQVVDLDAPQSSRILNKGVHDGPALQAQEASDILQWITLEKAAAAVGDTTPTLETSPFTILLCTGGEPDNMQGTCPTNHVALSDVGIAGGGRDRLRRAGTRLGHLRQRAPALGRNERRVHGAPAVRLAPRRRRRPRSPMTSTGSST